MMNKLGLIFLGFVAVVAIGGLTMHLRDTMTGQYYASGGGRWYYGPQPAQLAPDEACVYAGLEPLYPVQVYTNEYGTLMSLCSQNGNLVGVPLTQTILVR
jgi:hypothetical protein